MENLSLADRPAPGTGGGGGNGQLGPAAATAAATMSAPQLPPQMFTTAAQLLDLTDKKLLLVLRDGRKLIGVLRSWDQFANLVLTATTERYFVTAPPTTPTPIPTPPSSSSTTTSDQTPASSAEGKQPRRKLFADIPRGTYLVRGENVLLLGEIDLDRDEDVPRGFVEGSVREVFALKKEEEMKRRMEDRRAGRARGRLWGGEMEGSGEVLF